MPEVGHVVVIGGGAAGCATAYYLSAAGARVTIVEREGVGSQASGWSAGGLNPLQGMPEPIAALALESHRLHLDLWPELDRLTGRALGGRIISMAHLALDEAMIPALQDVQSPSRRPRVSPPSGWAQPPSERSSRASRPTSPGRS